jgi:hypothetical protein
MIGHSNHQNVHLLPPASAPAQGQVPHQRKSRLSLKHLSFLYCSSVQVSKKYLKVSYTVRKAPEADSMAARPGEDVAATL